MSTRIENIFRIRSLLDSPYPQKPNLHRIFQQGLLEEQRLINTLSNTGKAWATAEYQLNTNPNTDTYTIPKTDFGKALFVIKATGDLNIPFISVPFADVAQLDYGTIWLDIDSFYGGLQGVNYTGEKMAFYRDGAVDQDVKVKIQPQLKVTATYTITYLIGAMGDDDALGSTAVLPQHSPLIQERGSIALLPYCEWYEDEERNSRKRVELAKSLGYQLSMDEPIFAEYIKSMNVPRQNNTLYWDE